MGAGSLVRRSCACAGEYGRGVDGEEEKHGPGRFIRGFGPLEALWSRWRLARDRLRIEASVNGYASDMLQVASHRPTVAKLVVALLG